MFALIAIGSVALVLGVLVFVHEFGHYAVAKLCGVRVDVFSLGFGKRLWGFRRGETDYRISALPLGGYVKMAGENPMDSRTGDPGEFTSHPRWQRFLIAIAGPVMNILLALGIWTGVYMFHYEYPVFIKQPADIGWVAPKSPAEKAGIKPGDRIIRIDNIQDPTWEKVDQRIMLNAQQWVDVTVLRNGQVINTRLQPERYGPDQIGEAGLDAEEPAVVGGLETNRPAELAGIKPGDIIVAMNGTPVRDMPQFIERLQQNKDNPARLTVSRDGHELQFTVKPEQLETDKAPEKKWRLGFTRGHVTAVDRLPFGPAVGRAVEEGKTNSTMIFELIGRLIERRGVSIKAMSSPIGIAKLTGAAARQGPWTLLQVMAMISFQLALFNLLPIPILDGGLMLMLVIESIIRRDIKQEIKERAYQAALVFLLLFAFVVIYNDVVKSF